MYILVTDVGILSDDIVGNIDKITEICQKHPQKPQKSPLNPPKNPQNPPKTPKNKHFTRTLHYDHDIHYGEMGGNGNITRLGHNYLQYQLRGYETQHLTLSL